VRDPAHDVGRELRRAVGGDLEAVAVRESGELEEPRDAAAAGDVELEAVDRARLEQVERVARDVDVLACRDLETGGALLAHEPQSLEVGGGDRLLEPAHAPLER